MAADSEKTTRLAGNDFTKLRKPPSSIARWSLDTIWRSWITRLRGERGKEDGPKEVLTLPTQFPAAYNEQRAKISTAHDWAH
ncbi:MAG TPA: hypothetical protein VKU02_20725 [Gemmataceae bacterium]|nr:hypothetical protein [Gemmataceae bacterium]